MYGICILVGKLPCSLAAELSDVENLDVLLYSLRMSDASVNTLTLYSSHWKERGYGVG
jgi:hypothetical protein